MTLDGSGVLSVPAGITANLTGNSSTATKLATARTISLTGDVTYTSGSFDGSANVTGTATLANSGVTAGTYNNSATAITPFTVDAKGRITATGAAVTITPAFSSLTGKPTTLSGYGITDAQPLDAELTAFSGLATNGLVVKTGAGAAATRSIAVSGTGLSITNADGVAGNPTITSNATNANTASTLVARDASGNFSAGTITAALTGNASTATTLQTARNIALTGDATGTASFNGSANASISTSIPGIGNYRTSVLITANTTLTTSDFGKFYQIATNSGITVTLPSASGLNGKTFLFWANNVSATLSITASGGFFYGPYSTAGTSTFALSSGSVLKIVSDGFNWIVTSLAPSTGGTLGVINGGTGTSTQFTQGSVVFAGASGAYSQNNANFFWDNTNARLGIGTTSPDKALTVVGTEQVIKAVGSGNIGISVSTTGGGVPYFNIGGNRDWQLRQETTGELSIRDNTAVAERFRIDASGKVGIRTSTPAYSLDVDHGEGNTVRVFGGTLGFGSVMFGNSTTPEYNWTVASEGSINSGSFVLYNRTFGSGVAKAAFSGSAGQAVMHLYGNSNATCARFFTTANAGSMAGLDVIRDTYGPGIIFYLGSNAIGSVSLNSNNTVSYYTSSDYRLKSNVQDLTDSGAFIDALRPRKFTWNSDGSDGAGFIAHELQEVSPTSVSGQKDALDSEGKPKMQNVEYGSPEMIAMMVAELKALRSRVKQLEQLLGQ